MSVPPSGPPSTIKKTSKKKRKPLQSAIPPHSDHEWDDVDVPAASAPPLSSAPPPRTRPVAKARPSSRPRVLLGLLSFLASNSSLVVVLLTAASAWVALQWLKGSLGSLLSPLFTGVHNLAFPPWPGLSLAPVVSLYCAKIGVGCNSSDGDEDLVGGVARTVTVQATQALDLFDSVISLGKAEGVGSSLHHVAIWELALQELGDSTRAVRDSIIKLNSLALNSFTWILHEFDRLEELIERTHSRPSAATRATLDRLLAALYTKISDDLSSLLLSLDVGIQVSDQASDLGGRLIGALSSEHATIQREQEEIPIWKKLVERQGWKGKQMARDLKLAEESVSGVKTLRHNLERARSSFLEFSENVGNFKAGIIGYSISGHGLSAEDEIISLRNVLSDFRRTLQEAKGGRGPPIERPGIDGAIPRS
ncbi:hypothetical protein RQP46_004385 [Phenoliferia psychrophenolica]